MQRVFCAKFSLDNDFIISGSDDGNLRLWKARASEKLGLKSQREVTKENYQASLKIRYAHLPEVKRISRQRRVPKPIKSAQSKKHIMAQSQTRKKENIRKHTKASTEVAKVHERAKAIVSIEE